LSAHLRGGSDGSRVRGLSGGSIRIPSGFPVRGRLKDRLEAVVLLRRGLDGTQADALPIARFNLSEEDEVQRSVGAPGWPRRRT